MRFTKPDLCFNLTPVSKRMEGIKSLSQACSQRYMRSLPLSVARYVWSVQSLYKIGRKCQVFVGSENELISTFKWASFLVIPCISLNVQSLSIVVLLKNLLTIGLKPLFLRKMKNRSSVQSIYDPCGASIY